MPFQKNIYTPLQDVFPKPRGIPSPLPSRVRGNDWQIEHDEARRILPPPALLIFCIPNQEVTINASTRPASRLVSFHFASVCLTNATNKLINMRSATLFAFLAVLVCCAWSFPQKDGQVYSNEAIKQAQSTYLIPKDATIQKVQEGIELAAYESIPGNERINLFEILGDHVPPEVVSNLQGQIDQIGRN